MIHPQNDNLIHFLKVDQNGFERVFKTRFLLWILHKFQNPNHFVILVLAIQHKFHYYLKQEKKLPQPHHNHHTKINSWYLLKSEFLGNLPRKNLCSPGTVYIARGKIKTCYDYSPESDCQFKISRWTSISENQIFEKSNSFSID